MASAKIFDGFCITMVGSLPSSGFARKHTSQIRVSQSKSLQNEFILTHDTSEFDGYNHQQRWEFQQPVHTKQNCGEPYASDL